MDYSIDELIKLFQLPEQREKAFSLIVEKYKERLYWHIRKIVIVHDDANDVLQETFIKIWKNLGQFRKDSQFYTWAYKIATNESLNHLRKEKKHSFISNNGNNKELIEKIFEDAYFDGDELQKKLQLAILTLPEKQRIVFNMKYFEEMKYEDMSEILDTSVGALKASYHHAVKKVKYFFEKD